MSIVPKETIEVIAQSIGVSNLSPDVAFALAPDVEYRMREIMQEAVKCMRHSRRTTLTTDDVHAALTLKNVEPLYGFASGDPLRFKRAIGHKDLFYIDDKEVDFQEVIEAPLPKAPLDTAVACHWLAIEGVQPAIPENAPLQVIAAPAEGKKSQKRDGLPVDIKMPVKHVLSRELQLYFDKITELALTKPDSVLFKEALVSLSTDSGLHPLVPYFTCFIAEEVARGLTEFPHLFALMRVVWSLLQNPHIHIEPYLHQLMPSVVTCLVSRRLGTRIADNHWELRDFTANLAASICKRFGSVYSNLQTRFTKTLVNAFLDPKKALPQHYGAIQGLAALGPNVVRLLILPNLEPYLKILEPETSFEKQKNVMKRHEAWRVFGTLLRASGSCMYDLIKMFPVLPSPPAHAIWKNKGKVVTTPLKKRKASMVQLDEQPPPKKIAIDGPIDAPLNNSTIPSDMQVVVTSTSIPKSSVSDINPSSSVQASDETASSIKLRSAKAGKRSLNMSAILKQVWKEELNSGQLLVSLSEQFGERIYPFFPTPEMCLFL
uniref:TATA box binding protein associated factor (TAF) histone-like fold domain-containing protein n=1 Tax=Kalanchoe fedtschenkoi TaxID=63787 RepID=A0A7N0TUB3_KALFE